MCGLFNSALAGGRLPSIRQPAGEKLATKARMEEKLNVRKHKRQTRHQPSDSFALSAVADAYDGCSVSSPLCLSRSKPSQRVARHFGPWALDDPSFHFLSIQVSRASLQRLRISREDMTLAGDDSLPDWSVSISRSQLVKGKRRLISTMVGSSGSPVTVLVLWFALVFLPVMGGYDERIHYTLSMASHAESMSTKGREPGRSLDRPGQSPFNLLDFPLPQDSLS
ncbi:hypothetical protein HL42_5444 [Trichophyton rubrum]|nr:hypothetical protein HL42_5444 [Trichophyton rubrum]